MLWRFVMRDSYNTGFKVAAYVNLVFAFPYALVYCFFLMLGEARYMASYLDSAMRWSVAGPFFLNFFAIYVMIYLPVTDSSIGAQDYIALGGYLVYSFFVMSYTYQWVPGVSRYYNEESIVPSTRRA